MSQDFQLRDATPAETDAIAALVVAAYRDYQPLLTPENWQAMESGLSKAGRIDNARDIVAEYDDKLAGYVAYFAPGHSSARLFDPDWASIRLLAVSPDFRGQGLARLLTEACIARARADGAAAIGLHTSEAMKQARARYERMGFQEIKRLPAMFGLRYWQFRLDL